MSAARPRSAVLLARAAALVAVALAAWWALKPLPGPAIAAPELAGSLAAEPSHADVRRLALDTSGFNAPLWVAPPAPPAPPPQPAPIPPPPPLKLRLIAIVRDAGGDRAASVVLYDPDADRLLCLKEGDTIASGRVIERITTNSVSIQEPARPGDRGRPVVRTLALNDDPVGPGGGGGR